MIPPFKTPSNASYFFSGFHSATTSPPARDSSEFFRKLRICKPSGFAAPQPKHMFRGAYFSCSDSLMRERWIGFSEDDAKCVHRRRKICYSLSQSGGSAASICQRVEDNAFHLCI